MKLEIRNGTLLKKFSLKNNKKVVEGSFEGQHERNKKCYIEEKQPPIRQTENRKQEK